MTASFLDVIETSATIAAAGGDHGKAAGMLGFAEKFRESMQLPVAWECRSLHQQQVSLAKSGLSEEEFAREWEGGRALELDEVLAWLQK